MLSITKETDKLVLVQALQAEEERLRDKILSSAFNMVEDEAEGGAAYWTAKIKDLVLQYYKAQHLAKISSEIIITSGPTVVSDEEY